MNCHTAWQTNALLDFVYGVKDGDGVAKREEVQPWLKAGRKHKPEHVERCYKEATVISSVGEASLILT